MSAAGREVRECYRALAKTGDNIVGEVLRDQGLFREWDHYPRDDVYDPVTHAQFYYHAHPAGQRGWAEHGHFHTFLRPRGMPRGAKPADVPPSSELVEALPSEKPMPADNLALSHLIAISMAPTGLPIRMFTTNRWVTGETWYQAADVCAMLGYFVVDHTRLLLGTQPVDQRDVHILPATDGRVVARPRSHHCGSAIERWRGA